MVKKHPTVVSLFAGAGGMDLGFRRAGFEIVWANELDRDASESYRKNIGTHLIEGDINSVSSDEIPTCDLVIGGPPCQGFSVAGKMNADDPRSALIWQFVRVVGDKKPAAFVMENVKALAMLDKWSAVRRRLVQEFTALGYDVDYQVLDASDFGVPQQRERVFFIGTLQGDARSLFPEPVEQRVSVREALRTLPTYGQPGNNGICRAIIVPAKRPVMRASPYAGMLFNGLGRPIRLDRPAPTLPASMGGNKTPIIDQHALTTGEANWVEGYHAHLQGGGEPFETVPPFLRRLTVEECAAIQSFPITYNFCGRQSARFCQIGNAVPPVMAYHIATTLKGYLFETKTPLRRRRGTGQGTLFDFLPDDGERGTCSIMLTETR